MPAMIMLYSKQPVHNLMFRASVSLTLCKGKCVLDGDPSECICNRTDQDNRRKDRAEVLDHKAEDLFATEPAFSL